MAAKPSNRELNAEELEWIAAKLSGEISVSFVLGMRTKDKRFFPLDTHCDPCFAAVYFDHGAWRIRTPEWRVLYLGKLFGAIIDHVEVHILGQRFVTGFNGAQLKENKSVHINSMGLEVEWT